jgi:hypothetical protein
MALNREQVREAVRDTLVILVNGLIRPTGFRDEREEAMTHNEKMVADAVNAIMALDKPPTVSRDDIWTHITKGFQSRNKATDNVCRYLTAAGVNVEDE